MDEAEVDTDEAEISKGSEHKGAKKGSLYMLYGDSAQVKPNMIEKATLEGAHSVFKGIKNGHMQSKRASVATSRRRHARASFGSVRTHRSI